MARYEVCREGPIAIRAETLRSIRDRLGAEIVHTLHETKRQDALQGIGRRWNEIATLIVEIEHAKQIGLDGVNY